MCFSKIFINALLIESKWLAFNISFFCQVIDKVIKLTCYGAQVVFDELNGKTVCICFCLKFQFSSFTYDNAK